eukprot:CAMPEP_0202372444 /NCGR_PEP_ID=MMETSP1127-20130417/3642_1 /ASSEMBLY_ACC=CAM_ASM_000462 /TAXON_ID=3047 /ORGANISM="Dunaliella tertiolecta, Strain CCMP1320" /LENGTH=182 /DNA_ID=CAMNT_0048968993 /DNA_START=244 /DNA_END=792 /DNA_ORIENTATION=+
MSSQREHQTLLPLPPYHACAILPDQHSEPAISRERKQDEPAGAGQPAEHPYNYPPIPPFPPSYAHAHQQPPPPSYPYPSQYGFPESPYPQPHYAPSLFGTPVPISDAEDDERERGGTICGSILLILGCCFPLFWTVGSCLPLCFPGRWVRYIAMANAAALIILLLLAILLPVSLTRRHYHSG